VIPENYVIASHETKLRIAFLETKSKRMQNIRHSTKVTTALWQTFGKVIAKALTFKASETDDWITRAASASGKNYPIRICP
jgi:hypothetical protein